jgi:hypothetical protein
VIARIWRLLPAATPVASIRRRSSPEEHDRHADHDDQCENDDQDLGAVGHMFGSCPIAGSAREPLRYGINRQASAAAVAASLLSSPSTA